MLTIGLDHFWYHNQRQEEMLAEAQRLHMVQEALQSGQATTRHSSRFLGYIGKKLVALGTSLEERGRVNPQTEATMNQQITSCS